MKGRRSEHSHRDWPKWPQEYWGNKKEKEANSGVPGNKDEGKARCKLLTIAWGRWERKWDWLDKVEGLGVEVRRKGRRVS